MARGTTIRSVRVPDDVWDAAMAKARAEGTTVSAVIQTVLRRYLEVPITPPPAH